MLQIIVQSAALSAFSNLIAQTITNQRTNSSLANYDLTQVVTFALFSALNTPINVWWQEWLESTFPGAEPDVQAGVPNPPRSEKNNAARVKDKAVAKRSSSTANVLKKFALDQTVGAVLNIFMFIYGLGALRGADWSEMNDTLIKETVPIYLAGAKFWPLVSLMSFAVLPVQHRVLFGSIAGVLWNIYLSLRSQ